MIRKLDRSIFALIVAVAACRGEEPVGTGTETDGSSGGGSTTEPPLPTTTGTTEAADTSTGGPSSTGSDDSVGFLTTNTDPTSSTGPSGPQPNGAQCTSDDECESMNCYEIAIAMTGVCAECDEDQDCVDAGTGISCSLNPLAMTAECADGSAGNSCMSDAACMEGLFCDAVIEIPIPGVLPDTCGECKESADCTDPDICSPSFDLMMFSGQKKCVAPGSVPNDQLCPEGDEGNTACMSGHCTDAMIMGIITIHICGECETDMDCEPGQTCTPAMAGQGGLQGSVCM